MGEQTITSSGQRNMGNRLKEKNEAIKAGGDDRKITDCFHRFPI